MAEVRDYRPIPTGNHVQDVANRQFQDLIQSLRHNYGPLNVFGKGGPTAPVVTVPSKAAGKPPSGIGVSVQLTRSGTWVLKAAVSLTITGDPSQVFTLSLVTGGVTQQAQTAQVSQATDGMVMMHQQWEVPTVKGGLQCALYIIKDGGAGTSSVDPRNSTLSGLWQGPIG